MRLLTKIFEPWPWHTLKITLLISEQSGLSRFFIPEAMSCSLNKDVFKRRFAERH